MLVLTLQACGSQPQVADCGTFDLEQLDDDLQNGYFERAGIELATAVLVKLKRQLECERSAHNA